MKARFAYGLLALSVLGLAGLNGCGKSASPPATATAPADASAPKAKVVNNANKTPRPNGDGPDAAVYDFMEAVRTGDDETAGRLLTPLARQKVAEHHMVVAPPGTDTARFEISRTEPSSPSTAQVAVMWTDLDESGKSRTDQIVWLAKRVEEGWRISGVAAPVFDREPPIELNFEDPADMVRKQQAVREEMRKRAQQQAGNAASSQAQPPAAQPAPNQVGPGLQQAARPENALKR